MITSIFVAESWLGFDFNEDERWAPGRMFKGGPNVYLQFKGKERVEIANMWACVIDVAACINIISRLVGAVNYIEAINLVHLHELCHVCDDGEAKRYNKKPYTHTYYWNRTLVPLSKINGTDQFIEAEK